ncbi:MAG: hypothetical protein IPM79_15800 [Polyangiaceae bacterium]|nr:hypothetical protein [Polyangiaceae bacterium]MBK8939045.1 hypothetical protein [Polyangiaceae bacterium]
MSPTTPGSASRGRRCTIFDADVDCKDGFQSCSKKSPLAVVNCTGSPIVLSEVQLSSGGPSKITVEPAEPMIAPGAQFAHALPLGAETYEVTAWGYASPAARAAGEVRAVLARATFTLANPALAKARAECEACQGLWGPVGMLSTVTCNCKMKDAGKTCDDGDDCEGVCLFDKVDVIQPAKPTTCDAQGACSGSSGLGRPLGKCSERRLVFGCRARIKSGASKEPPQSLPIHASPTCVD